MDAMDLVDGAPAELVFGRARVWEALSRLAQAPHDRFLLMYPSPRNLQRIALQGPALPHIAERLSLVETSAFSIAGMLAALEESADSGAQLRVSGRLPLQMVVLDDEVAVVSLTVGEEGTAVLVRGRAQCRPLVELFEGIWREAQPLGVASEHQLTDTERVLMGLLAAGNTDVAAARAMGISDRSVRRHVRTSMQKLGVTSRTQLGLRLGSLNLVPQHWGP